MPAKTPLRLLEGRLDASSIMGFAIRASARHYCRTLRSASMAEGEPAVGAELRPGDEVALSGSAKNQLRVQEALTVSQEMDLAPSWVEVDAKKGLRPAQRRCRAVDLPSDINESLIIELYSK